MNRRIPALAAALTTLLLMLATAAPVLAGGWAEIVADPAAAEPPVQGEDIEVGFTVMQHGETPAPWEQATVRFTDLQSGRSFEVTATSTGADGHFLATTTIPTAGFWSWTVTLGQLATDQVAFPLTVHTPSGVAPTLDPALVLTRIDAARREAVNSTNGTLRTELDGVNAQLATTRAMADRLQQEVLTLQKQLNEVGQAGTAPASEGLSPLAIVLIAILAGATAGFVMVRIAGSPGPRNVEVGLSPTPRGADPA